MNDTNAPAPLLEDVERLILASLGDADRYSSRLSWSDDEDGADEVAKTLEAAKSALSALLEQVRRQEAEIKRRDAREEELTHAVYALLTEDAPTTQVKRSLIFGTLRAAINIYGPSAQQDAARRADFEAAASSGEDVGG